MILRILISTIVIMTVVFTAIDIASAEGDLTPLSDDDVLAPGWTVTRAEGVIDFRTGKNGAFWGHCEGGACSFYVRSTGGCWPGRLIPALGNSNRRLGILTCECVQVGNELVYEIKNTKSLLIQVLDAEDFSLAVPTAGDEIEVINVPMTGVLQLIKEIIADMPDLPKVPKKPESLDKKFDA